MARWRIVKVLQQGVISDPNDPKRSGTTTKLLVDFTGVGEREVELAPTIDKDGIIRTLNSMVDLDYIPGAAKAAHGPPADDLLGVEG